MKKIVSTLLLIMVVLLNFSCGYKGGGFNHRFEYYYIDEHNNATELSCDINYSTDSFDILLYENDNKEKIIDSFSIKQYPISSCKLWTEDIYTYDNVVYVFCHNDIEHKLYCYYKTIGSNENIQEQFIVINDNEKYLNINNLTFFNDSNDLSSLEQLLYEYNVIQDNYNQNYYSSLTDYSEIYNIDVKNEEVVMTNYFDSKIKYTYKISEEIKDAKYIFCQNTYFDDWGFGASEKEKEISKNSYSLIQNTTKLLNDNNLYFAYGRYLGEFETGYCFLYSYCILSNRMCEILRFNTSKKEIERVALIPETYTVLAIYEDCAIIMNNERIGTYYYNTQEIKDSIEVDIAGDIFEEEYEWPDVNAIKFYFKDKKIEKYQTFKS